MPINYLTFHKFRYCLKIKRFIINTFRLKLLFLLCILNLKMHTHRGRYRRIFDTHLAERQKQRNTRHDFLSYNMQ